MGSIRRFEDIEAWQAARELAQVIYAPSSSNSFARDYALRDQISRSSGSAMDNIPEGFDAGSNAEFCRFPAYSQRSCSEVQSQLYRALDRGHITKEDFEKTYEMAAKTKAKVGGLINYLKKSDRLREDSPPYPTPSDTQMISAPCSSKKNHSTPLTAVEEQQKTHELPPSNEERRTK